MSAYFNSLQTLLRVLPNCLWTNSAQRLLSVHDDQDPTTRFGLVPDSLKRFTTQVLSPSRWNRFASSGLQALTSIHQHLKGEPFWLQRTWKRCEDLNQEGLQGFVALDIDGTCIDDRGRGHDICMQIIDEMRAEHLGALSVWNHIQSHPHSASVLPDPYASTDEDLLPTQLRKPWDFLEFISYFNIDPQTDWVVQAQEMYKQRFLTFDNWREMRVRDGMDRFVAEARKHKVNVLFVSLRGEEDRAVTENMLRLLGVMQEGDHLILKPGQSEAISTGSVYKRNAEPNKANLWRIFFDENNNARLVLFMDNDPRQCNLVWETEPEEIEVVFTGSPPPHSPILYPNVRHFFARTYMSYI